MPDVDRITPGAILDMNNCYVQEMGVRTFPALGVVSTGLPTQCYGMYTAYLLGSVALIGATINGLYTRDSNGVFQPGVTGLANTLNRWRFSTYGQYLIAVDGVDVPYFYSLASGWAPLTGSPPISALTTTTDYAVILVPPNSQTLWSNLAPTAAWTPSTAAQVYEYSLANVPGNITAVTRKRSYLAVYRATALQSATFVGGAIGWDFGSPGTISLSIGSFNQENVVNTGDYDFFVGTDYDFWQFDGYNLNRIPNHVKEFFSRDINQNFTTNIAGRYDVGRNLVVWHYPSVNTTRGIAGQLDSYIGFYMRPQPPTSQARWFYGRLDIELPLTNPAPEMQHTSSGVVLLDHNLYLYDDANPWTSVSGTYVVSNDFGDRQHVFRTRRVMPGFTQFPMNGVAGGPPAKITPMVQMICGTTPVAKPATAVSQDGWFNIMVSGRLIRYRIDFYNAAEIAQGFVDQDITGEV